MPLGQRNICTLAPFTVIHLAYLVVLQNLVGVLVRPHGRIQRHSEYPTFYLFLFLHFPRAVSSDFCISNMWLNPLMYRITHQTERISFAPNNNFLQIPQEWKRRSSNRYFARFKEPVRRKSSKNNSNLT